MGAAIAAVAVAAEAERNARRPGPAAPEMFVLSIDPTNRAVARVQLWGARETTGSAGSQHSTSLGERRNACHSPAGSTAFTPVPVGRTHEAHAHAPEAGGEPVGPRARVSRAT